MDIDQRNFVMVVSDAQTSRAIAEPLAAQLRRAGIKTGTSWAGKMKSQIRRALAERDWRGRYGPRWLVICEGGQCKLRFVQTGRDAFAPLDDVFAALLSDFDDDAEALTPLADALVPLWPGIPAI